MDNNVLNEQQDILLSSAGKFNKHLNECGEEEETKKS